MKKFMLWIMLFISTGFSYVNSSVFIVGSGCFQSRNSTVNTVYQTNLKTLLYSLAKNVPLQDNFFNTSVGNGSNQVYGIAWCRADVSHNTCSECLNVSIGVPLRSCPENKRSFVLSSLCSLRFSNQSFFGELWNFSSSAGYNPGKRLDDPVVFSKGFSMMKALVSNVSNQPLMFETGVIDVGKDGKRYGLCQCGRDLSKSVCENCLEKLLATNQRLVLNRTQWEMKDVSCGIWYDNIRFYQNNSWLTNSEM